MDLFAPDRPDDDVGVARAPEPGRTPPPARAPRAGELDLDDWPTPAPDRQPRRWLLAAAVVPWVVVLAFVVTGSRDADGTAPAAASPSPTVPAAASESATPTPSPLTEPPAVEGAGTLVALGGQSGPSTRGLAEGVAVVVARSWLSTRPGGPPVTGLEPAPGADARYVEHVAVEAVDHPARGAAVVTVRAVVLPVEGDAYGAARQLRLAVPVSLDAHDARPAGTPWLLPVDDLELAEPTTEPVDDVDLMVAAAEAVSLAGYRDVSLASLLHTDGWAWVAQVDAVAPGELAPRRHAVWLRSDVGRLVVAGTIAAAEVSPAPTASPSPTTPEQTP